MDTKIVLWESQEVELVLGAPLARQRALVFVDARVQLANTVDGARRSDAVRRLANAKFRPRHRSRPRRRMLSTPPTENGQFRVGNLSHHRTTERIWYDPQQQQQQFSAEGWLPTSLSEPGDGRALAANGWLAGSRERSWTASGYRPLTISAPKIMSAKSSDPIFSSEISLPLACLNGA